MKSVIEATDHDGARDEATRSVLLAETRGQALVAAALNDRANLDSALATVHDLDEHDTLAHDLADQAKAKPRAPLSLARFAPEPTPRSR